MMNPSGVGGALSSREYGVRSIGSMCGLSAARASAGIASAPAAIAPDTSRHALIATSVDGLFGRARASPAALLPRRADRRAEHDHGADRDEPRQQREDDAD